MTNKWKEFHDGYKDLRYEGLFTAQLQISCVVYCVSTPAFFWPYIDAVKYPILHAVFVSASCCCCGPIYCRGITMQNVLNYGKLNGFFGMSQFLCTSTGTRKWKNEVVPISQSLELLFRGTDGIMEKWNSNIYMYISTS